MRLSSGNLIFPALALLVFSLILFTFPYLAKEFINFSFAEHWNGGSRARFDLGLWLVLNIIAIPAYYIIAAWAIRHTAGFAEVHSVRVLILVVGGLLTAGFLLYNLWKGADISDATIQRIIMSGLIGAITAVAISATRTDPDAPYDVEQVDA
jgi:hypothetical protein